MPDVRDELLRIHCLCGQKMKVSERMYGMPGKCIACRQKIRIPNRDELPEGTTEIYLKDYPDLLREPPRVETPLPDEADAQKALAAAGEPLADEGESTPNTELDLAEEGESPPEPEKVSRNRSGGAIAIDLLPMLQILCSLEYKFERQLRSASGEAGPANGRTAELEGYLTRVRNLRADLDDYLHQLLMEVAIELSATQEKIARTKLEGRTGEQTWPEYQEQMRRLRSRRDRLERRQHNLRGWLATRDPYTAGGLLDLSVENIPEEGFSVALPHEAEDGAPLLTTHLEGLREAMAARVAARERAEAVRQMEADRSTTAITEVKREADYERRTARARVAFFTERLERLKRDCVVDEETADAQLAIARDRLKADEITREQYDFVEAETAAAKKDLARIRALVTRALSANVATEVPHARGTLFDRLGVGQAPRSMDVWAAWGAGALLIAAVFLPAVGSTSLANAYREFQSVSDMALWCLAAPVLTALAVLGVSFGPSAVRGPGLLAVGLVGSVTFMVLLHESAYSLDPIAARFRAGPAWFLRPGMLVIVLGLAGVLASGGAAMWPERARRPWIFGAGGVAVLAGITIFSDVAGAFRAEPRLEVLLSDTDPGEGVVRVVNDGGRAMHLLARPTDARGSFLFLIERRVGVASFGDASGDGPLWEQGNAGDDGVLFTVAAGGMQEMPFRLPPAEYRVLLENEHRELSRSFVIEAPQPVQAPPSEAGPVDDAPPPPPPGPRDTSRAAEPADAGTLDAGPDPEPEAEPGPSELGAPRRDPIENPPAFEVEPTVELVGILTSQDDPPRFTFRLRFPDGSEERVVTPLGGRLWGEWTVGEYNPEQRTVTLDYEGRILILRRGGAEPLDLP